MTMGSSNSNSVMGQRVLEINVAYAEGLKDVNFFTKMDVYVVVSIIGGSSGSINQKTNIDRESGTHPTWNFPMRFTIDELCALQGLLCLVFRLKCEGSLIDSDVGEVCVPIKDLLDSSSPTKSGKFVHYQVTSPSGRGQGMLTFSYKFCEKINESQPADRAAEAPQPLESYPYLHPYQDPALHEQVLGPEYTYQPAPRQYPNPYPCPYPIPPEQATGSLYSYVIPNATPWPDYAYSSYQRPLEVVYPPPSPGAYVCPPQPQPAYPYAPQPEPSYAYSSQAYMGYGYR